MSKCEHVEDLTLLLLLSLTGGSVWGLFPLRFCRVYLQEEDFLERKKKKLQGWRNVRDLSGGNRWYYCAMEPQNPGDVKSARGYTGNKMSRTEAHGLWNLGSDLMQHFLSVGRKCCRKTSLCVCVFPLFVFQEYATSGRFLLETGHHRWFIS